MNSMKPTKYNKGFTIIETMIAVMVFAIIAAFAVANYNKSRDLAIEEDVINQLKLIYAAQNAYFQSHGRFMPNTTNVDAPTNIAEINSQLGLNIIYNGKVDFVMVQLGGGASYQVQAVSPNYTILLNQQFSWTPQYTGVINPNRNPRCSVGTCPSLK